MDVGDFFIDPSGLKCFSAGSLSGILASETLLFRISGISSELKSDY